LPVSFYSTKDGSFDYFIIRWCIVVIIDRKTDRNADTGLFELIHRLPQIAVPPYIGVNLQVEGQSIKKPFGCSISAAGEITTTNQTDIANKMSGIVDTSSAKLLKCPIVIPSETDSLTFPTKLNKLGKTFSHSAVKTNPHISADRLMMHQRRTMFGANSKELLCSNTEAPPPSKKKTRKRRLRKNSCTSIIRLQGSGILHKSDSEQGSESNDLINTSPELVKLPKSKLRLNKNISDEYEHTIEKNEEPVSVHLNNDNVTELCEAALDKRSVPVQKNVSLQQTTQNKYDEYDDLIKDAIYQLRLRCNSNVTHPTTSTNELPLSTYYKTSAINLNCNQDGSGSATVTKSRNHHASVEPYWLAVKMEDHMLSRRAVTHYPTVQAMDFLSSTVNSIRQSGIWFISFNL